jgi:peptidoglycan/xylan/chitin deacetylase (PgdA/CDA1 family)
MARRIVHLLVLLLFLLLFLSLSLLGRQNERLKNYEETLFQKEQDILTVKNEKSDIKEEQNLLKDEFKKLNGGNEKTVILTFDDGPSPVTLGILDILKEKEVKAIFFY